MAGQVFELFGDGGEETRAVRIRRTCVRFDQRLRMCDPRSIKSSPVVLHRLANSARMPNAIPHIRIATAKLACASRGSAAELTGLPVLVVRRKQKRHEASARTASFRA
jgi:hypothetical protein